MENSYSPLFSPISTHSSHNVPPTPSLFNPKRTISSSYLSKNTAAGAYVLPQRAISLEGYGLRKRESEAEGGNGFLKDITNTLFESGKFVWQKIMKGSEKQTSNGTCQASIPQDKNKRKHGDLSNYYLIPRKLRRISKEQQQQSGAHHKVELESSNNDKGYRMMTFCKDPFKWNDWKTDVINPRSSSLRKSSSPYSSYGTSFVRKNKLARQPTSGRLILRNQLDELAYLRMIFNGEYEVPKMIGDERENQFKMLQKERQNNTKMKKYIVDLTEKIKNIILEKSNDQKEAQDDDLMILKEHKLNSLEKRRKEYRTQRQRFDQSKVDVEGEFKMYRQLLDERRQIQEEVRKKKEGSKRKKLLPPISESEVAQVEKTLRRQDNVVLTNKDNIEVTVRDFRTLAPRRWLNDTVIEFFMHYIEREASKTVSFNSYFYTNLSERGYQGVRRWMRRKKVKIGDLDKIFIPVNLNESHWALGMVDMPSKTIVYVDSLSNGPNAVSFAILSDLRNYVVEESNNTMGSDFTLKTLRCPQQPNGFDCGIYLCLNTLYLSQGSPLSFTHDDAVKMRQYIAHLILSRGSK